MYLFSLYSINIPENDIHSVYHSSINDSQMLNFSQDSKFMRLPEAQCPWRLTRLLDACTKPISSKNNKFQPLLRSRGVEEICCLACGTPNRSSLPGDCTPDHASFCNCKSGMFKTKEQQERKQCTHLQDLNDSWGCANSHRDGSVASMNFTHRSFQPNPAVFFF